MSLLLLLGCGPPLGDTAVGETDRPADSAGPDSRADTGESAGTSESAPPDSAGDSAPPPDTAPDTGGHGTDTGDPSDTGDPPDTASGDSGDTGGPSVALASGLALTGEGELARAGAAVAATGDMDGDGAEDLAVLAPGTDTLSIVRGPVTASSPLADAGDTWTLDPDEAWTYSLAGGGDLDGDGAPDVVVGMYGSWYGPVGEVFVLPGTTRGPADLTAAVAVVLGETWTWYSEGFPEEYGWAGTAVAVGDVDGDGAADLVVTDPAGLSQAYVVSGPLAGDLTLADDASATLTSTGSDTVGAAVALGDLDGDGADDLLIGSTGEADEGVIYLAYAPTGEVTLDGADGSVRGETAHPAIGALAAGDADGDGYADLVIGASTDDGSTGAVWVVSSPIVGEVAVSAAGLCVRGESAGDYAGISVGFAGDTRGDGVADLLVGGTVPSEEYAATAGGAWLVGLPASGTISLRTAALELTGARNQSAGWAVAGATDLDGDGVSDLVVGGPGDDTAAIDAGLAWIVSGAGLP